RRPRAARGRGPTRRARRDGPGRPRRARAPQSQPRGARPPGARDPPHGPPARRDRRRRPSGRASADGGGARVPQVGVTDARVPYVDVDGTLVGPSGDVLSDGSTATLATVAAILRARRSAL